MIYLLHVSLSSIIHAATIGAHKEMKKENKSGVIQEFRVICYQLP